MGDDTALWGGMGGVNNSVPEQVDTQRMMTK